MAKARKLSRDEVLVRAAHFRAAIMAFVKKHPGCTPAQILEGLEADRIERDASESTVLTQIHALIHAKQIEVVKEGRHAHYHLAGSVPLAKPRSAKAPKSSSAAPFVVDISKSTGRVRLHIAGLTIEIGVVD